MSSTFFNIISSISNGEQPGSVTSETVDPVNNLDGFYSQEE